MNFNCSYSEVVPLHKLVKNPRNPNRHSEEQIHLLAKIIDYQGQRSPIVVSKNSGFIVKGHGRLEAIKQLGWESAAVDFQEYESAAQEYADLEADNRISELSHIDNEVTLKNIEDLDLGEFDLELLGVKDDNVLKEWESDIEEIKKQKDELNDVTEKIKITCMHEDKQEIIEYLELKLKETSFRNITIR